jgi:(S)-3,5-dihydroxyphenylglycine transaminase
MLELSRADLHGSLGDPVMGSMTFLTEIMRRYPDAISFAPGAPHVGFLDDLDLPRCIDSYLDYLQHERGMDAQGARRLLYEYGPGKGLINDLVARALRADLGIDVPPESVVITVGAQEAMLIVLRALYRSASDLLAVISPCFVGITGVARLLGIGIVPIQENSGGIDFGQLENACAVARARGERIRALYVAADFSNPSGTSLDLPARHRLLDMAAEQDLLLLEDNAYAFTAPADGALPSLKALDRDRRVIHLGTFAKLCLPGARVGFAVADQRVRVHHEPERLLADELAMVKTMVTVNTSPVCQAIVAGMLLQQNGSINALAAPRSEFYRDNLARLLAALARLEDVPSRIKWNRPTGGFFVRMYLPRPADLALLEISASEHGVVWTPMAPFHLDGGGANELRLSCSYLDPEEITAGVRRLGAFLRQVC